MVQIQAGAAVQEEPLMVTIRVRFTRPLPKEVVDGEPVNNAALPREEASQSANHQDEIPIVPWTLPAETSTRELMQRIVQFLLRSVPSFSASSSQPPQAPQAPQQQPDLSQMETLSWTHFGSALSVPEAGTFFVHARQRPWLVVSTALLTVVEVVELCGSDLELTWLSGAPLVVVSTLSGTGTGEQLNTTATATTTNQVPKSQARLSNEQLLRQQVQQLYSQYPTDEEFLESLRSQVSLPVNELLLCKAGEVVPLDWRIAHHLCLLNFDTFSDAEHDSSDANANAVIQQPPSTYSTLFTDEEPSESDVTATNTTETTTTTTTTTTNSRRVHIRPRDLVCAWIPAQLCDNAIWERPDLLAFCQSYHIFLTLPASLVEDAQQQSDVGVIADRLAPLMLFPEALLQDGVPRKTENIVVGNGLKVWGTHGHLRAFFQALRSAVNEEAGAPTGTAAEKVEPSLSPTAEHQDDTLPPLFQGISSELVTDIV